jgi:sulfatase modifying factor 1
MIQLCASLLLFAMTLVTSIAGSCEPKAAKQSAHEGMIFIPAGTFTMGSDDDSSRRNEGPPHQVTVDGFWIDEHPVTNAQFQAFIQATGYTTTAERAPTWEELQKQLPPGSQKPDESLLVAGSMVFTPSDGPVDRGDMRNFWRWVPGANWKHPEGPHSDIKTRMNHPVVQVSWDDAATYARWSGKRLPTEAEWEFAARGGREKQKFPWGNEFQPGGKFMANTWQGNFPYRNTGEDGFIGTAPVKSFPPNGYGLYDMAGNVWQWCSDWYRPDTYTKRTETSLKDEHSCHNPSGPDQSFNPVNPTSPERVTKGGSFLCHASYCESYRPAARRGTPADTGMSHIGFRCASSR